MRKKAILMFLAFATLAVASAQESSGTPSNKELVTKAKTLYVESDTFYMKRERLQSCLLASPEFKAWDLQITGSRNSADLLVEVRRIPFTNHFTYTVTDRGTNIIVMAGKVDSLGGTVYQMISNAIIHTMKGFRGDPVATHKQQPQAAE